MHMQYNIKMMLKA